MCFSCCFLEGLFVRFWRIWASNRGPCWGLHETKHAEIEARKLVTFGRLLGGAGGSGEACRTMQILQSMVRKFMKIYSRPAPPAGVRRILRATPSAAGPLWFLGIAIWEPWCLLVGILEAGLAPSGALWVAILASREHLGRQFWHLGTSLEDHGSSRMDSRS